MKDLPWERIAWIFATAMLAVLGGGSALTASEKGTTIDAQAESWRVLTAQTNAIIKHLSEELEETEAQRDECWRVIRPQLGLEPALPWEGN